MRIKLTLRPDGPGDGEDLTITADTTVSVGMLARHIHQVHPQLRGQPIPEDVTLRVEGPSMPRLLVPTRLLDEAGLVSGSEVAIVRAGATFQGPDASEAAAVLRVVAGPDKGRTVELPIGSRQVGRHADNEIRLTDPMVSKAHLRVNVSDIVEVVDLGSSNGIVIDGERVSRAVVAAEDQIVVGDTVLTIEHRGVGGAVALGAAVEFNRSPFLDPRFPEDELTAPEPPPPPPRSKLPIIALLMPLVMGVGLFAITREWTSVAFIAFTPLLMIGTIVETRRSEKRATAEAVEAFREQLAAFAAELSARAQREVQARNHEHPVAGELLAAERQRSPRLWSRHPGRPGYLALRLGTATLPSRTTVELPPNRTTPPLWAELQQVTSEHRALAGLPVVASFTEQRAVGVAGPRDAALAAARSLVVQLVTLHSPAEVVLCALASSATAPAWDWLKWLPHTSSDHSPLSVDHLAAGPAGGRTLVSALEELVDARLADEVHDADRQHLPTVVVLVEDDASVERSRIVELAENGAAVGVHAIWVAPSVERLPAVCGRWLHHDGRGPGAVVGDVGAGTTIEGVDPELVSAVTALDLARSMAPLVDAGARVDDATDLPQTVSFLGHVGPELARSADAVVERWRMSDSLPDPPGAPARRRRVDGLAAFVGQGANQPVALDLRAHGPHALVGGTTGSGKSELLQSWILGMAVNHSPAKLTFLFIDYKGGAAFRECTQLPHCVGLVTDLSPHLVWRALESLRAELRHREKILHRKGQKDVLELERRGDPDTPPSLVIVVDEFAALVQEIPDFVDGVVDVAQRGRSLGLHLILATQRPAGVIKDNLRANTNLRLALRMADESESEDVVGSPLAAGFDPALPGRGVAKLGPGRLTPFQGAYVGGWTSEEPPEPVIRVDELSFGAGHRWEVPEEELPPAPSPDELGPTDLQRLVDRAREAAMLVGLDAPRRPWLDELPRTYDLARAPQSRTDDRLIFGIVDRPKDQVQDAMSFDPDRDGNMAVFGTGGAGKSAFLRTVGIVAGLSVRGGPCHVYGLDFGTRGLSSLEVLPHVGTIVNGEDDEGVARLLRMVRDVIDDRAGRFSAVRAGSITQYRELSGHVEEPRLILLVDNMGAFRSNYEVGPRSGVFEQFLAIGADGRPVGVHVVVAADRYAAVPAALASVVQRRLVLRMANESEYQMLNAPVDAFSPGTPPGRGFLDDLEVQVAVLAGTANSAVQAAATARLADEMGRTIARSPAPRIERLAERVALAALPVVVNGNPTLGVAYDTLQPIGFTTGENMIVVGPAQSGRSTVMATVARSLRRARPGIELAYLGLGRSPLRALVPWDVSADGAADVGELAKHLADRVAAEPDIADRLAVFVDDVPTFLNGPADFQLGELFSACERAGVAVHGDGETSALVSSWPLFTSLKARRHGIALAPDQMDGDTLFRAPFPRVQRAEFPPGRGFYVRNGRATRLQVALPEEV